MSYKGIFMATGHDTPPRSTQHCRQNAETTVIASTVIPPVTAGHMIKMGPMKCIEDLPDEILVEIFSSVAIEDLVHSVQYVCSRWKDVGQDNLLWRDRVYNPDWKESDTKIAHVLGQTPKLQTLLLKKKGVKSVVLDAVTQNCPYLKKLEFCDVQKLSIRVLKNLLNKCPNIEYLSIPNEVLYRSEQSKIVGQFNNLKILKVGGWAQEEDPAVLLRPIADGCPALEYIDLRDKMVSTDDFKYFLQKKGSQLHTLCVKWDNTDTKGNLPLLSVCTALKTLHVGSFCEVEVEEGFDALQNLRNVTCLTLGFLDNAKIDDVINLFHRKAMNQLKELVISFYYNYEDRLADVIVKNCPRLKVLCLEECSNLTDRSVEKFHTLRELKSVNLCSTGISDVGVAYLGKCKKLKYLNLDNCMNLAERSMKILIDFSDLRVLKLRSCDIKGLPLHLIPTLLKHLTLLNINYCKNVNKDAVAQLHLEMPRLIIRAFEDEGMISVDDCDHDSILEDATFLFEQF